MIIEINEERLREKYISPELIQYIIIIIIIIIIIMYNNATSKNNKLGDPTNQPSKFGTRNWV